jgi:hypothetical protein
MDHVMPSPIALPSDEELAMAILKRMVERQRLRDEVAELWTRIEWTPAVRPRGTS